MDKGDHGRLSAYLNEELDFRTQSILKGQLVKRAEWQIIVSQCLAMARENLARMEDKYMLPAEDALGKKVSETERKIRLASAVAPEQRQYDEMADLSRILSEQIQLGMALLK